MEFHTAGWWSCQNHTSLGLTSCACLGFIAVVRACLGDQVGHQVKVHFLQWPIDRITRSSVCISRVGRWTEQVSLSQTHFRGLDVRLSPSRDAPAAGKGMRFRAIANVQSHWHSPKRFLAYLWRLVRQILLQRAIAKEYGRDLGRDYRPLSFSNCSNTQRNMTVDSIKSSKRDSILSLQLHSI